jgi:tetratricopeptide (TPR) repeat protein
MKVFLSHSGASVTQTDRLRTRLVAEGIQPVDATSLLQPGHDWASAIQREVREADGLVFLVEPGDQHDPRLQEQWKSAIHQSWSGPTKPMIPVLVGDAELPGFLRDRQAIKVTGEDDWNRVAEQVAATLKRVPTQPDADTARVEASQASERKQRLDEITQDAKKLEPTREELTRQVNLLRDRIREVSEHRSGSVELAELHVELSDALKRLGDEAAALPELEAAAAILAKHPEAARRLARVRTNLATLLSRLGQKQEARTHLESARDLYAKLEGPESLAVLVTRATLVSLLNEVGDRAAAAREQEALKTGAKNLAIAFGDRIFPTLGRFIGRLFGGPEKGK